MTQKDKELLLKDLCARLLYNVKELYNNKVFNVDYISAIYEEIKLDSNTRQEYLQFQADAQIFGIEYLLKNHFDYRGLIEKGLAIDASGLNSY